MMGYYSRSMRGRPGSLKNKYQTLKENGEVGSMTTTRRTEDFDIKILQLKTHEAEIKRLVTYYDFQWY